MMENRSVQFRIWATKKYQSKTLSQVEKDYIDSLKNIGKSIKELSKNN